MASNTDQNLRPDYDQVIQDIVDYVRDYRINRKKQQAAHYCLLDTLVGAPCPAFPGMHQASGPIVEGTVVPHGLVSRLCLVWACDLWISAA